MIQYYKRWYLILRYEILIFLTLNCIFFLPLSFFLDLNIVKFLHIMSFGIMINFFTTKIDDENEFIKFLHNNNLSLFTYFFSLFSIFVILFLPTIYIQIFNSQSLFIFELLMILGLIISIRLKSFGKIIILTALFFSIVQQFTVFNI